VARRVIDGRPRARVVITGMIVETQVVSRGNSPVYRCTLEDGSGELDILFLGRSSVPGFSVGTRCSVEGLALKEDNRLAVWNPLYRFEAPVIDPGPSDESSVVEEATLRDEAAPDGGFVEKRIEAGQEEKQHLEAKGGAFIALGRFGPEQQAAADEHKGEAGQHPALHRAGHFHRPHVRHEDSDEPKIGDQDETDGQGQSDNMGAFDDGENDQRFADGGPDGGVLNPLEQGQKGHVRGYGRAWPPLTTFNCLL